MELESSKVHIKLEEMGNKIQELEEHVIWNIGQRMNIIDGVLSSIRKRGKPNESVSSLGKETVLNVLWMQSGFKHTRQVL